MMMLWLGTRKMVSLVAVAAFTVPSLTAIALNGAGCSIDFPRSPLLDIDSAGLEDLLNLDLVGDRGELSARDGTTADTFWRGDPVEEDQWRFDGRGSDWRLNPDGLIGPDALPTLAFDCPTPLSDLAPEIRTHSFVAADQGVGEQNLFVYTSLCAMESPNNGPEGIHAIQVDSFARLSGRAECNGPCYVAIFQDGCGYGHMKRCFWNGDDELDFAVDLLPGLYLVVVEFIWDMRSPVEDFGYRIHAAVNRDGGLSPCPTRAEVRLSELEEFCDHDPRREGVLSGFVNPLDTDRVYVSCGSPYPLDPRGGMPDHLFAFHNDLQGSAPVALFTELSLSEPAGAGAEVLLSLTSSPCGASSSVIDCTGGSGIQTLGPTLVFPGESVYAVVEPHSAHAFSFTEPLAYQLRFWTASTCSTQAE